MIILAKIIMAASNILFTLLCIRALCTWLFMFRWPWVDTVYNISLKCTEFFVAPCRKLTERFNTGMFDWSMLLACIVLILARDILVRLVMMF